MLLDSGADVDAQLSNGASALLLALKEGYSYFGESMAEEGVNSYRNALSPNPLVQYNLGTVRLRRGEWDLAIREFEK